MSSLDAAATTNPLPLETAPRNRESSIGNAMAADK